MYMPHIVVLLFVVALCVRAWIEILASDNMSEEIEVALCVRAWIEIVVICVPLAICAVALCVRAWIEISCLSHNTV